MKYGELIELYKKGKLEEEKRKMVENDIERHEAISEYLFNESEIPELKDLKGDNINLDLPESTYMDEQEREAVEFTKIINSTIRKAFIKMGMIVGGILLAILLVVMSMPKIVALFYYNPAELIEKQGLTNRISLDFATYSEIFLPGNYRCNVIANSNGNGNYDINILQHASFNGKTNNVAGKIEKGKLVLYDPNLLNRPAVNLFGPVYEEHKKLALQDPMYTTYARALERVNELNEIDYYVTYFTLDEIKDYDSFVQWTKEQKVDPLWCAIDVKENDFFAGHIGFNFSNSSVDLDYDKKAYPYLTTFDASLSRNSQEEIVSEEVMRTHVVSMFRYMADQKDFGKMMGFEKPEEYYTKIANLVEKQGLNIYGFVVVAQKDTLLHISKADGISYIYPQHHN